MLLLAIESSCDETSIAIVKDSVVLSNIISSQIDLHKKWGGVVPDIAKRAHQERIIPVINTALKRAKLKIENIDLIAVTKGPGLAIALGVGVKTALIICCGIIADAPVKGGNAEGIITGGVGALEKIPRKVIEFLCGIKVEEPFRHTAESCGVDRQVTRAAGSSAACSRKGKLTRAELMQQEIRP